MKKSLLLLLFLGLVGPLWAQQDRQTLVRESDTLTYTYVPLEPMDSEMLEGVEPADSTAKPGFLKRVVNYFAEANVDRTFEKKLDFTFIGGPSYSSDTKLSIGVMGAGLYRTDRTDSLTPPSDVTLFGSASITGFYVLGIRGNTLFKHDKNRLTYRVSFASRPLDYWGVGYNDGAHKTHIDYTEKLTRVEATYLHLVAKGFYMGADLRLHYIKGKNFDRHVPEGMSLERDYLYGMRQEYLSTGLGVVAQYDTRDFAPNAYKGVYIKAGAMILPKGLGTVSETLWKFDFTISGYQRLWSSGVLAMEAHGEFNSKDTPWPFMARMGGDFRMRSYYEGRYTDLNMITAQVELRQRIWRRISCAVWGGAGTVFSGIGPYEDSWMNERSFSWSQILPEVGLGLRWEFKKRVNIRFDFGVGKDSTGFIVQINEAF